MDNCLNFRDNYLILQKFWWTDLFKVFFFFKYSNYVLKKAGIGSGTRSQIRNNSFRIHNTAHRWRTLETNHLYQTASFDPATASQDAYYGSGSSCSSVVITYFFSFKMISFTHLLFPVISLLHMKIKFDVFTCAF